MNFKIADVRIVDTRADDTLQIKLGLPSMREEEISFICFKNWLKNRKRLSAQFVHILEIKNFLTYGKNILEFLGTQASHLIPYFTLSKDMACVNENNVLVYGRPLAGKRRSAAIN